MHAERLSIEPSEDAYDWTMDLHQRLVAAKPGHTVRGLFLHGALNALRALRGADAARRCLEAAGAKRFRDVPRYPIATNVQLVFAAARELSGPSGDFDEALRQLGQRVTADVLASAAGKVLRLVTGGRPEALVNSLPGAYRASVNHGKREVTWTGPTSGRLSMEGDFLPWPYHEGVLLAVLEAAGAREPRVHTHRRALLDGDYAFSWD